MRFLPGLVVNATDHRRIEAGPAAETLHSLVRCVLLSTNLMPRRYRGLDLGLWQSRNG